MKSARRGHFLIGTGVLLPNTWEAKAIAKNGPSVVQGLETTRSPGWKIWLIAVVLLFSFFHAGTISETNVAIQVNGQRLVVRTDSKNVGTVLEEAGIMIGPKDTLFPRPQDPVVKGSDIIVTRAVPVKVLVDGREITLLSNRKNVGSLLEETGIRLGEADRLEPAAMTPLEAGIVATIVRVERQYVYQDHRIYFQEKRIPNPDWDTGTVKILSKGEEGTRRETYEVSLEDGKEVARRLIDSQVVKPKQDRVVMYGVISQITRNGKTYRFRNSLPVIATAYYAGKESTGKDPGHPEYGITSTGLRVRVGHVAVDPKVVPLLSSLYVEGLEPFGRQFSGEYQATDTGSAIKGQRIDIYLETIEEALRFGRRRMKVYVLVN